MATGIIQGVFTDVGRIAIAQSFLGPLARPPYAEAYPYYFKIGEGGYILGPGGGKSPKAPDPSRIDLESETTSGLYTFTKIITADKFSYELNLGIPYAVIELFVDLSEANDDGTGNSPEFFEIGIFDAQDVMLIYATIPGETKNASKTLNHILKANF